MIPGRVDLGGRGDPNSVQAQQFGPTGVRGVGQGPSLIGGPDLTYLPEATPLTDDTALPPPPDPKPYATYDGSRGPGKTGDAAGAHAQGVTNVVKKVKDALD
ncbi:hypothetical protein [Micromonospora cremea]|uniref:Mn-containing catalase n=1 Tax=Micromonospora cremea TaxID=709881 RepID=A0A1N5WK10_9ACTN|nr:hypothetical protein [Micromonospora cremea]SIM85569.1 Mn-containing catalase [Micromonospora cremea]